MTGQAEKHLCLTFFAIKLKIKSQAAFIEINSKCYLMDNSYRLPSEKGDNVQLMFIYILSVQHTKQFVWQNMSHK